MIPITRSEPHLCSFGSVDQHANMKRHVEMGRRCTGTPPGLEWAELTRLDTCFPSTGASIQWRRAWKWNMEMFTLRHQPISTVNISQRLSWFTTVFSACDFRKEVKPFGSEWFCTSPEKQNLLLCTSGAHCFQRAAAEWTEVLEKKWLPLGPQRLVD